MSVLYVLYIWSLFWRSVPAATCSAVIVVLLVEPDTAGYKVDCWLLHLCTEPLEWGSDCHWRIEIIPSSPRERLNQGHRFSRFAFKMQKTYEKLSTMDRVTQRAGLVKYRHQVAYFSVMTERQGSWELSTRPTKLLVTAWMAIINFLTQIWRSLAGVMPARCKAGLRRLPVW